jgi:hypothetical protein
MKQNLVITQGNTFSMQVRWELPELTFKTVSAVTNAAPPVVTCSNHGVPDNWRGAFTNVGGMDEINADDPESVVAADFYEIDYVDANSFKLKGVDATGYGTYTSGGVLRFYAPVNLAGYTARMHIRQALTSTTTLLELTTENGRIAIDETNYVITLTITAADTEDLTFASAVYSLELVSGSGAVTTLLEGTVKLNKEITR